MRKPEYTIVDDLAPALSVLHDAHDLLRDLVGQSHGTRKRRVKYVKNAVFDAIGAIARQGLTVDEYRAAVERARAG
jgi:hypothetical protein